MTPAAFRKQQERQRRKDAGLLRIEAWVKPDDVQAVKLAIALIVDDPHAHSQPLASSPELR